jgi:5'-nucleotidase
MKIATMTAGAMLSVALLGASPAIQATGFFDLERDQKWGHWFKKPRHGYHKDFNLTILHINDHHSHLEADDFDFDVSDLSLSTITESGAPVSAVEVTYGGFPLLVDLFQRQEKKLKRKGKNYLKIHAGDAITGTLFYTLFEGQADADMMNQVCFDAFALGNHEFDGGDSGLAKFLDALAAGDCDTPVLAANVVPSATSAIANDYIKPFVIKRFGREKVGLIGIDIAKKTKESSSPDEGTEFLDELETAQKYIDELRNEHRVNKIVLVTHYQYANDVALANALDGVDVIVGGDSHSLLGGQNLVDLGFNPVGDYPTVTTDAQGNKVCVVQAWEYAHVLGKLNIKFDHRGNVKSCGGKPMLPVARGEYSYEYADRDDRLLSGLDKRIVNKALRRIPEIKLARADTETSTLLASYQDQVDVLKQTVIGSVAEDLCFERFPGQGRSAICDVSATAANGSDISNIVAKAFLTVTPTADIAIQNGGGVRVDVAAGDFTIADAFSMLPFSNTLVTLEMTGQQVIDVLEEALEYGLDPNGSTGAYPYAAGLRYNVDLSQAFGSRISNVEVNPRVSAAWSPIDPAASYTIVTNNFIAAGRDGYTTFGTVFADPDKVVDTFTEYAQGFIDYVELLAEQGLSLQKLPLDEYSTQLFIDRNACNHSTSNCVGY